MHLRTFPFAFALVASSVPAPARAAGPLSDEDRLEELAREERRDPEDLPRPGARPRTPLGAVQKSAWVALDLFGARHDDAHEVGLMAIVSLPLDRVAAGGVPITVPTALAEATAAKDRTAPRAAGVAVSPSATRDAVRAAWRAAGLDDDEHRIDGAITRARASAALPELRLRAVRTSDDSLRLTPTDADPFRYQTGSGAGELYELRVTFRLDRLLFADEETSLERLRLDRVEARARVAARTIVALFDWQRATLSAADPSLGDAERLAATLRALEAAATLDVLTAGWFSRWNAASDDD